ncbi:hypothetical protein E3V08_01305 [Candidatus Atribacteria bacterium MT.SAG.1]|nr:hypothetical protein E3V08_01305 [Candidatus Atribacteria bacterium MT.SAG.1]
MEFIKKDIREVLSGSTQLSKQVIGEFKKNNGHFILKIFESQDTAQFIKTLSREFYMACIAKKESKGLRK